MSKSRTLFSDKQNPDLGVGEFCHQLAQKLWPICRSLSGDGNRQTLNILAELIPNVQMHSIQTGETAFDWEVPEEWNIREAYIENEAGERIVDFANNNLHVMGYSIPVNTKIRLEELENHLYSLPDQPDDIPYITSYYSRNWGFCLSHNQRKSLKNETYKVVINSELKDGVIDYADLIIKGSSNDEILISTYICHPSMANNELSGPVVATALAKWLMSQTNLKHSFRFVFIPETIGSIIYLSRHLEAMKQNTVAGFNLTCMGDEHCYSHLPSRNGNTIADVAARHVLHNIDPEFKQYTWLDRGSDERQYCAPGIDLPVTTIMRSKYGTYPQYHTSADNLEFVTPKGLEGGFSAVRQAIEILEKNATPLIKVLGEPQLGKRGLYPNVSTKASNDLVKIMMDTISYCDGNHTILEIAEKINAPFNAVYNSIEQLVENDLIEYLS